MNMKNIEQKLRHADYKQAKLYFFCNFIALMIITAYALLMKSPTILTILPEGGDSRRQMYMIFVLTLFGCVIFTIYAASLFFRKNTADWDFDGSWRFQKGTDTGDISRGVYFKQSFFSDRYAGWYSTDVSSLELLSTFGRKPPK